jgi:acylphosphatase
MQTKRIHAIISGRVQGVFYRSSTAKEAQKLNLTGWVKNLPDGRVELMAEGPEEQVNKLIKWCHNGPKFAAVNTVNVEEETPTGEYREFFIKYD